MKAGMANRAAAEAPHRQIITHWALNTRHRFPPSKTNGWKPKSWRFGSDSKFPDFKRGDFQVPCWYSGGRGRYEVCNSSKWLSFFPFRLDSGHLSNLWSFLGTTLDNPHRCTRYNSYRFLCSLPPVNWTRNLRLLWMSDGSSFICINNLRLQFFMIKSVRIGDVTPWGRSPLPRFMTVHDPS